MSNLCLKMKVRKANPFIFFKDRLSSIIIQASSDGNVERFSNTKVGFYDVHCKCDNKLPVLPSFLLNLQNLFQG